MLTVPDKLLLAAFDLEQGGRRPFSAEDLVVSAWRKFPDAFGLAGYRDDSGDLCYPDSNRVFAEIMGSKPIRKRGLLAKVGSKMYQLTEAGRDHARLLLRHYGQSLVEKAALPREMEQELRRLFTSKAVEKVKNNRLGDLTFYDACSFWGISPRSSAIELEGRIANFEKVLDSVRRVVKSKMATFEHRGQAFGASDLDTLLQAHQELLRRFDAEIEIIHKRTDERA
ncbi:MAG: hypothetical protein AB1603_03245 [Chloroflexota bacterium]